MKRTEKLIKPHPVAQMKITLLSDGTVVVQGYPNSLEKSQDFLTAANKKLIKHFIKLAKEDGLDENNEIIKKKIITPPQKTLVSATGAPLK